MTNHIGKKKTHSEDDAEWVKGRFLCCLRCSVFVVRNIQHLQQSDEGILAVKTGVSQPAFFVFPLSQTPIF